MKTSLAIILAVAALISGATVSLNPGTASAQTLAQIWCTKGCPPQLNSGVNRPTSRSVRRNRDASRSLPAGSPSIMEVRDAATDEQLDER